MAAIPSSRNDISFVLRARSAISARYCATTAFLARLLIDACPSIFIAHSFAFISRSAMAA
eukprot:scaffold300542_cov35-Tisochrysis_lutea.AAC.1